MNFNDLLAEYKPFISSVLTTKPSVTLPEEQEESPTIMLEPTEEIKNAPEETDSNDGVKPIYTAEHLINKLMYNMDPKDNNSIYYTKFTKKDIPRFAKTMKAIFSNVLDEEDLPKDNVNNLVMQAALESDYGTNPRGNGYNLGGIKAIGPDREKVGTKWSDNNYYRNFNNLYDYARYVVHLLDNRYNAIRTSPDNFIAALHGDNPGKYSYSGSSSTYAKNFQNMISLRKALNETL